MSKVFLDIDIGDAAAWQQATDAHARATEFLRSAGHQVTMIACMPTCIHTVCRHADGWNSTHHGSGTVRRYFLLHVPASAFMLTAVRLSVMHVFTAFTLTVVRRHWRGARGAGRRAGRRADGGLRRRQELGSQGSSLDHPAATAEGGAHCV